MVAGDVPEGAFARGFRLGKLGLSLTGSYLGYQVQNLFVRGDKKLAKRRGFGQEASRRVRKELEQLKGPVMKFGQILSSQVQALPDEVIEELANLQMHAPGMHPTLARAQFKSSCGKYPEDVFREFEPEPFAAASLGQVHRAITRRGEKVAVKIQYPAIREAIEDDFKLLRSATFPGRVTGHMPVALLNEIQRGFSEETDYIKEARNSEFFRKALAFPYLHIPAVHWDTTTDRVLTMSFIEGAPAGEFLATKPSQKIRDLIGARLIELYYYQIHKLQTLHADHHPGNYLFRPDGQIGMVDFGCVKRLSIDAPELGRCCIAKSWNQGKAEAEHVIRLIWGKQKPVKQARDLLSSLEKSVDILFPMKTGDAAVVDFGKAELLKAYGHNLRQVLRHKLINPEFAFLSRAELGLYGLLHQIGARVNAREVWERSVAASRRQLV